MKRLRFGEFQWVQVYRGASQENARLMSIDAKKMVLTTPILLNNSESQFVYLHMELQEKP